MSANLDLDLLSNLHFITLERYHAMIDADILGENDAVELLNGKIVDMSPIGKFHAVCVDNLAEYFIPLLKNYYRCRQEQPITIPAGSEPEPDYVIAKRHDHQYRTHHPYPEDIYLIIEVADKTLAQDRGSKRRIYASAGINEYWVFNLIERQLEIYTDPDTASGAYQQERVLSSKQTLINHRIAGTFAVDDLLP